MLGNQLFRLQLILPLAIKRQTESVPLHVSFTALDFLTLNSSEKFGLSNKHCKDADDF